MFARSDKGRIGDHSLLSYGTWASIHIRKRHDSRRATGEGEHVAYWKARLDEGKVLVFGSVLDPKEAFGIAIVDVKDEAEMRALIASDPAVKAGVHVRDEFHPMSARSFVRK